MAPSGTSNASSRSHSEASSHRKEDPSQPQQRSPDKGDSKLWVPVARGCWQESGGENEASEPTVPQQQPSGAYDSGNMMDRWLNESQREQPYHGIGAVAMTLDQYDFLLHTSK